jgi:hypothetical protein
VQLYSSLTSALDRGGWSAPRTDRFTTGKDPVPIVQEAGWAPGPVSRNNIQYLISYITGKVYKAFRELNDSLSHSAFENISCYRKR